LYDNNEHDCTQNSFATIFSNVWKTEIRQSLTLLFSTVMVVWYECETYAGMIYTKMDRGVSRL